MAQYRGALPQLSGDIFICDGGLETDLIFNHDIGIPEFAAHTLLSETDGRDALRNYFRDYLDLAKVLKTGFILDSQTWKAHSHWAGDLNVTESDLREANHESVEFISILREEYSGNAKPIVLNGLIGPKGDGYAPDRHISQSEAEDYHRQQIAWLAETDVDMVSAMTFTQAEEAAGLVKAAKKEKMPVVVSFTVETDGNLPTGQPLSEAIQMVDDATKNSAAYFMINCAHPDHFIHILGDDPWAQRIRGIRANASCKSHAELDESETLDDGNPVELGIQFRTIKMKMPWINIYGGCCGSDLRHVTEITKAIVLLE